MNAKGFGPAVLDRVSTSQAAIRGREEIMIDIFGGARSRNGTSGNAIAGISLKNPNRGYYLATAHNQLK